MESASRGLPNADCEWEEADVHCQRISSTFIVDLLQLSDHGRGIQWSFQQCVPTIFRHCWRDVTKRGGDLATFPSAQSRRQNRKYSFFTILAFPDRVSPSVYSLDACVRCHIQTEFLEFEGGAYLGTDFTTLYCVAATFQHCSIHGVCYRGIKFYNIRCV